MALIRTSAGTSVTLTYATLNQNSTSGITAKDSYVIVSLNDSVACSKNGTPLTALATVTPQSNQKAAIYHMGALTSSDVIYIEGRGFIVYY